jgi:hypothetical protein
MITVSGFPRLVKTQSACRPRRPSTIDHAALFRITTCGRRDLNASFNPLHRYPDVFLVALDKDLWLRI